MMSLVIAQAAEATTNSGHIPGWVLVVGLCVALALLANANAGPAPPAGVQPQLRDDNALAAPEFDAIAPASTEVQRASMRVHVEIDEFKVEIPAQTYRSR